MVVVDFGVGLAGVAAQDPADELDEPATTSSGPSDVAGSSRDSAAARAFAPVPPRSTTGSRSRSRSSASSVIR